MTSTVFLQRIADLYDEFKQHDARQSDRLKRYRNIEAESAKLLAMLVRSQQSKRILEIGTSTGYSTLWLAEAAKAVGAKVQTLEINAFRSAQQKVELLFEPILQMNKQCLAFHIEAIAVAFYYSLLELAGQQLQRYQVYLSVAEPKYKEQYVHLIKANFHFNYAWVAGLRVVIDQQQLALPLPLADAHSLKVVEQRCQEQIQKIYHQGEIVEWVSMMLRQANQIPTLKECAKVLNISTKTLQRYLQQQGVEFHRLKQEISIERAIDLLENSSFTITHIAYELGYSNPANFTRAFNKVMGCSPQNYRLNHHK